MNYNIISTTIPMRYRKTSYIRSFEKVISSPLFIIIFFLVAIFLFVRSVPLWKTRSIIEKRLQERENRHAELQRRDQELDKLLQIISTDEGKKQILKRYYGLGEEGERIIFLTEDDGGLR